jgi:hypothetical protein
MKTDEDNKMDNQPAFAESGAQKNAASASYVVIRTDKRRSFHGIAEDCA